MSKTKKQNSAVVLDGGSGAVIEQPIMEPVDLRTEQPALN